MNTKTKKRVPLTVYGLLALKHNVKGEVYVGKIVRGERRAIRGKAKAILDDWKLLERNLNQWFASYKCPGSLVVEMEDIRVNVFIQHGIASIYKDNELMEEIDADLNSLTVHEMGDFLNEVRIRYVLKEEVVPVKSRKEGKAACVLL